MQKKGICSFIGISAFLLASCGEENPAVFPIETSSNDISLSSSFSTQYSSSINDIESSSSIVVSSNVESSSSSWEPYSYGEITDERDGQTYKTIKIGEQTWMAENLNYAYLQPTSTGDSASECHNNDPGNCTKYGRLYTWHAAIDSIALFSENGNVCDSKDRIYYYPCKSKPYIGVEGVCPDSWHVPTRNEAMNLVKYANTSSENFEWIKHYWLLGENEENNFLSEANVGYVYFWISEESERNGSKIYIGPNETEAFYFTGNKADLKNISKSLKVFVRCVKDNEPPLVEHGEMTDDRDGQVYKTVKIGTQTWMAENLNYAYPHKGRRTDSISWCYNNASDNCAKYGRLYTWEAAMDCHTQFGDDYEKCRRFHGNAMNNSLDRDNYKYKGLCPENWHIPSGNEWDTLLSTATITDLKSTSGWSNEDNGTNIFRFSLLPAGIYEREAEIEEGFWSDDGAITCFWTPGQVQFTLDNPGNFDNPLAYCFYDNKKTLDDIFFYTSALSVRCVKDAETSK